MDFGSGRTKNIDVEERVLDIEGGPERPGRLFDSLRSVAEALGNAASRRTRSGDAWRAP
jgi:hypothetical protein